MDLSQTSFWAVCMSLCCVYLCEAQMPDIPQSASSVYPNIKGVRRHWWWGVSMFSLLSPSRLQTQGEVSKAATCHISVNTQLSPVMSHCLASVLRRVRAVLTPLRPFSWFWELWFPAFVCISVRRAELTLMMSSHPCADIGVCVRSTSLSVCCTQ